MLLCITFLDLSKKDENSDTTVTKKKESIRSQFRSLTFSLSSLWFGLAFFPSLFLLVRVIVFLYLDSTDIAVEKNKGEQAGSQEKRKKEIEPTRRRRGGEEEEEKRTWSKNHISNHIPPPPLLAPSIVSGFFLFLPFFRSVLFSWEEKDWLGSSSNHKESVQGFVLRKHNYCGCIVLVEQSFFFSLATGSATRPPLSHIWSLKIRRTAILNCIRFTALLIPRL